MRLKSCMISIGFKMAGECLESKNFTANKPYEVIIFLQSFWTELLSIFLNGIKANQSKSFIEMDRILFTFY